MAEKSVISLVTTLVPFLVFWYSKLPFIKSFSCVCNWIKLIVDKRDGKQPVSLATGLLLVLLAIVLELYISCPKRCEKVPHRELRMRRNLLVYQSSGRQSDFLMRLSCTSEELAFILSVL
jgi:hypothetical protein